MAVFTREAILVRVAAQRRFFSVKGMYTQWPVGFDPVATGAVLVDD